MLSLLYDGFKKYQKENSSLDSRSHMLRKELDFMTKKISLVKEHFESQVKDILELLKSTHI